MLLLNISRKQELLRESACLSKLCSHTRKKGKVIPLQARCGPEGG